MNEMMQSTLFWAGLIAFVGAMVLIIDQVFRRIVNRAAVEAGQYPHRVANELPRTLHRADHDEVLELKDEAELSAR